MSTAAEQLNRRLGRMEALASDLAVLRPGYQPTDLEMMRARELMKNLDRAFGPDPGPPQEGCKLKANAGKTGK